MVTVSVYPHVTVRLVLELMAVECADHPLGDSSAAVTPRPVHGADATALQGRLRSLQATVIAASSRSSDELLSDAESPSSSTSDTFSGTPGTTPKSLSEEKEEEELEFVVGDRGRMGAGVAERALSRDVSFSFSNGRLDRRSLASDGRPSGEARAPSALDELDHPKLTGAVAAVHAYVASGGNAVFLERAYDLARAVAGSRHELAVAFHSCRMALAVGYVHTLKNCSSEMARMFALHHSLPKLALSTKPYWVRGTPQRKTLADKSDWEECMLLLLEVLSSVALLANQDDILSTLDPEVYDGMAEAIGLYCTRKPRALQQYPDVGSVCKHRYMSYRGIDQQARSAPAEQLKHRASQQPVVPGHESLEGSE